MGRASLKRGCPSSNRLLRAAISRPYGPGLIEALKSASFREPYSLISRPYGPGLIEAICLRRMYLATSGFPGPMGRASLKLDRTLSAFRSSLSRFPGPMGRASLKRYIDKAEAAGDAAGFPGPMGRASLKRHVVGPIVRHSCLISRPYGPGLIEAQTCGRR